MWGTMSLNLRQVAQVLAGANDALIITDGEGRIQDTNAAHARLTGYTQDEVIGKNLFRIHGGLSRPDTYKSVWREIKRNQNWKGEISNRRKTGEVYSENLSLCAISDSEGKAQNFIAVMSDLSDDHGLDSVAWKRANYDYVTGLPNRQLFLERLDQEIRKYRRNGSPMALLLLDLDRFKEVNDTLGHMKGDVLLEEAARRICRTVRETDTVSRLGGGTSLPSSCRNARCCTFSRLPTILPKSSPNPSIWATGTVVSFRPVWALRSIRTMRKIAIPW